jgi:hypothetical protein
MHAEVADLPVELRGIRAEAQSCGVSVAEARAAGVLHPVSTSLLTLFLSIPQAEAADLLVELKGIRAEVQSQDTALAEARADAEAAMGKLQAERESAALLEKARAAAIEVCLHVTLRKLVHLGRPCIHEMAGQMGAGSVIAILEKLHAAPIEVCVTTPVFLLLCTVQRFLAPCDVMAKWVPGD